MAFSARWKREAGGDGWRVLFTVVGVACPAKWRKTGGGEWWWVAFAAVGCNVLLSRMQLVFSSSCEWWVGVNGVHDGSR